MRCRRFLGSVLLCFVLCISPCFAYTFPTDTYHAQVQCSLGNVTMYIPYNVSGSFSLTSSGVLVNTSSAAVYGYIDVNGAEYQVRFSTFELPEYRQVNSSYSSWSAFNMTSFSNSNIPLLNDMDFSPDVDLLLLVLIGGVIICLLFIKR